jgi:hypothetical protein
MHAPRCLCGACIGMVLICHTKLRLQPAQLNDISISIKRFAKTSFLPQRRTVTENNNKGDHFYPMVAEEHLIYT